MNELEMIITAFLTRARARLPAVFWVKCHLSWRRSSSLADSSAAGGFPVATATGFYARGAALQTNEGKHSFLFIILSPPPPMLYCYSLVLFLTHPLCVCLCVCRTWRRRRITSGTPRDWTPWSWLQSRASPSTSPRCAAAREEAGGGREWGKAVKCRYVFDCHTCDDQVWLKLVMRRRQGGVK